jgi:hypothetical protein
MGAIAPRAAPVVISVTAGIAVSIQIMAPPSGYGKGQAVFAGVGQAAQPAQERGASEHGHLQPFCGRGL